MLKAGEYAEARHFAFDEFEAIGLKVYIGGTSARFGVGGKTRKIYLQTCIGEKMERGNKSNEVSGSELPRFFLLKSK